MKYLFFPLVFLFVFSVSSPAASEPANLRVATFQCDVTPPIGHWLYAHPLKTVEHPLLAKGIVLEQAGTRYVLCAIDWCVLSNESHARFRGAMAEAAGTDVDNATIQCTHVHTAVVIDSNAKELLADVEDPPAYYDPAFLNNVADKLASGVQAAVARLEPCDRIGTAQAKVERVASDRRIMVDGQIRWRGSSGGRNPALAELPEGTIDPYVKTITFACGHRPMARVHYYATHPQSFYRDARASYDFVGMAREKLQEEEGVFQVYFTGCAGDVAAGKYNDGSREARQGLYERLLAAMKAKDSVVIALLLAATYAGRVSAADVYVAPDRYHGPGIYTQNKDGQKWITDCMIFANYSTTIQAYGSKNAWVDHFRIVGNFAFDPIKAGGRQRILVGGGRPSVDILVAENVCSEVPIAIGPGDTPESLHERCVSAAERVLGSLLDRLARGEVDVVRDPGPATLRPWPTASQRRRLRRALRNQTTKR